MHQASTLALCRQLYRLESCRSSYYLPGNDYGCGLMELQSMINTVSSTMKPLLFNSVWDANRGQPLAMFISDFGFWKDRVWLESVDDVPAPCLVDQLEGHLGCERPLENVVPSWSQRTVTCECSFLFRLPKCRASSTFCSHIVPRKMEGWRSRCICHSVHRPSSDWIVGSSRSYCRHGYCFQSVIVGNLYLQTRHVLIAWLSPFSSLYS